MKLEFRVLGAVLCAAALVGCAFSKEFADQAVDYNKTVETTANRQMLLNALRARDRLPLYFATISKLTGAVTLSIDAGIDSAIGLPDVEASGLTEIEPSVSVTHENSPFFDLAPQLSREFMAGMLKPMDMELMDYFWQQTWPEELLLYLTVKKVKFDPPIRFCNESEPISVVRNTPGNEKEMDRFRRLILLFRNFYSIDTERRTIHDPVGPLMTGDAVSSSAAAIKDVGAPLGALGGASGFAGKGTLVFSTLGNYAASDRSFRELLSTGKGKGSLAGLNLPTDFKGDPRSLYLLAQERQVFEFHFSEEEVGCDGQDEFVKIAVARDSSAGKTATDASPNGSGNMEQGLSAGEATEHPHYSLAVGHRKAANGTGSSTEQGALPKHISIHMFLRGTQDMVYYLGELLRRVHYEGLEPIKIDLEPPDLDPSNDQVLFALDELGEFDGEDHGLSLEYGGKTYGVPHNPSEPANPAGRTTEVLAFLNQLLALNQSSSALPATTATVISQ